MGEWWIGKDTKEISLGLLQNTISGVAGVTEEKYQWWHNTQFCGQVLNHTSPDSNFRTLPMHKPAQWHYILWLLVTSTVEKLSAIKFCLEHEIIMILWNGGNLETYYWFLVFSVVVVEMVLVCIFTLCSSFVFFWVKEGHTASIFRVTEFATDESTVCDLQWLQENLLDQICTKQKDSYF